MKLGIIGRGPWGDVYAKTLRDMGIDHWQAGRDWEDASDADGYIIASAPESHHRIADTMMFRKKPVLIEKPMTKAGGSARRLLNIARTTDAIAFVGHTRLYSPAWREFKREALADGVTAVYGVVGGGTSDHWWGWGPHLVAMCLDLDFDPHDATLITTEADVPLHFDVNGGNYFSDVQEQPTPLEVLISEFVAAIEYGAPDYRGVELGVRVVEYLEEKEAHWKRQALATS